MYKTSRLNRILRQVKLPCKFKFVKVEKRQVVSINSTVLKGTGDGFVLTRSQFIFHLCQGFFHLSQSPL